MEEALSQPITGTIIRMVTSLFLNWRLYMSNLVIKQTSGKSSDPFPATRTKAICKYDFCKSREWGSSNSWLLNKRNNGWDHREIIGLYTKFKLELIK
jgi:hypothetical protein